MGARVTAMESLDGFAAAHADIVSLGDERKFVRRRSLRQGKVALISGGGSGHEPLHAGFVGQGMLDAACPGQVFTSPTPDQMIATADAIAEEMVGAIVGISAAPREVRASSSSTASAARPRWSSLSCTTTRGGSSRPAA
jgi:dihydroxyacetone kinase